VSFDLNNYSIKTKVLLPTTFVLFVILIIYSIIYSRLFITIKSDAFNDHNILTQINNKIYNIRLEGDNIADKQLSELEQLSSDYLALVLATDGEEEEEELTAAQAIKDNTYSYIKLYRLWLVAHNASQTHNLPNNLITQEKALLTSISIAKDIVQEEATEDLESLFQYEIISSIIIYSLILAFVAYGVNLITRPLIKLTDRIYKFNHHSSVNLPDRDKNDGDEILLLKNSFYQMRTDIINKQELLEKALEEAKRANEVKIEFLANISHELRTPMLGILGFAELGITKLEDADKSKLLKYFSRIHTSGSRLLRLLNNLLDLSKLEANQMIFDIQEHDLQTILDSVMVEQIPLINSKELEIKITSDCQVLSADVDKHRMHQVFYNLLSNAIKFTPKNSIISINFSDDIIEFNSDCVAAIRITMSDQGIGIPDEELSSIFEKFSQSSRTKTGAGGTGLGLSICTDICQYHHGKLWAENLIEPEQGAKFTLLLPKVFLNTVPEYL